MPGFKRKLNRNPTPSLVHTADQCYCLADALGLHDPLGLCKIAKGWMPVQYSDDCTPSWDTRVVVTLTQRMEQKAVNEAGRNLISYNRINTEMSGLLSSTTAHQLFHKTYCTKRSFRQ